MLKRNKVYAFSIMEVLISFILIGIIFIATIVGFNKKEHYDKLYWQAFNTLFQASKSIQADWQGEVNDDKCTCSTNPDADETCYKPACWRNSKIKNEACRGLETGYLKGTKNIERDFPGFLYNHDMVDALIGQGQDREFCLKFTEKINTAPGSKCESFISATDENLAGVNSSKGGVNFYNVFSSVNQYDEDTKDKTGGGGILPSFTAANGQQFYISSPVTANFSIVGEPDDHTDWSSYEHIARESYRFVVVDLNGKSAPNTQFKLKNKNPDLVLFIINALGDVIPLGLPEFSREYLNAVVYYPTDLNPDGTLKYPNVKSEPMSLWKAKKYAWGMEKENDTNKPPYRSPISESEPLSISSKIYATAVLCQGKSSCSQSDVKAGGRYADDLFVNLVLQFIYSKEGSADFYPEIASGDTDNTKPSTENGCKEVSQKGDIPVCTIDFEH